jgi:predicted alpha/beta-fold hydrolase
MFIAYLYPKAPLLGLGFSLGANVMTRYLAEEGHHSRLVSGCALACVSPSFPVRLYHQMTD